jgi:hypothetical protein
VNGKLIKAVREKTVEMFLEVTEVKPAEERSITLPAGLDERE